MTVHPNYFGFGAGSRLLEYICRFTDGNGYQALRLTQSALNLDSFSLYNRYGFVPRQAYQDMILQVPESGLDHQVPGLDRGSGRHSGGHPGHGGAGNGSQRSEPRGGLSPLHPKRIRVSGRSRSTRGPAEASKGSWLRRLTRPSTCWGRGSFERSSKRPTLIHTELDRHRGRTPVFLVPVDRYGLVRQMYDWGARNCELHFAQVRGRYQPYQGINMPTFLLETA